MKAPIYNGRKSVSARQLPDPVCGPRDFVAENLYASISATDVEAYTHGPNTGHRITAGQELGHKVVSWMLELEAEVEGLHVGELVYSYPLLAKDDPSRAGTIGGVSQRMLLPSCVSGRWVYPVSPRIPVRTAADTERALNVVIRHQTQ